MFENIFTFKINPWIDTGTIADLVQQSVLTGEADILTDISEVDVLVGTNICFNIKPTKI